MSIVLNLDSIAPSNGVLPPFKMKQKEDLMLLEYLEQEIVKAFDVEPDEIRREAKRSTERRQEEQRRGYDKKCKMTSQYRINDFVAIERIQFGTGLKLKGKYLGPYVVYPDEEGS